MTSGWGLIHWNELKALALLRVSGHEALMWHASGEREDAHGAGRA